MRSLCKCRKFYEILGRNTFAEDVVNELNSRVPGVKVKRARQQHKLDGCRVFELPVDKVYQSSVEISAVGQQLLPFLVENGWLDLIAENLERDVRKRRRRFRGKPVYVYFLVSDRCRKKKEPCFLFYWQARSKRN